MIGQWSRPEFGAIGWRYCLAILGCKNRLPAISLEAVRNDWQPDSSGAGFSDAAGARALASSDVDATGVSPRVPSRSISGRGQVKSSARPAGANKGSPVIKTRAACASIATCRDPGPPSNWSVPTEEATKGTIGPANGRGAG